MFEWLCCGADTTIDDGAAPSLSSETNEIIKQTNLKFGSTATRTTITLTTTAALSAMATIQKRHVVAFSRNFRIDERDYLTMEEVLRDEWLCMESNGYYCETTLDATRSRVTTTQPTTTKVKDSGNHGRSYGHGYDSSCCEYRINAINILPFVTAIPQSILKLEALETLNLSQNALIEYLPRWIGDLKNLKHLDLSFTKRLRQLPDEIGRLQQLLSLTLVDSGIVVLPNTLHMLKNLQSLELRGCEELMLIPSSIGCLANLKELDLYSATKLQRLPEEIGRLKKLYKLNLSYSNILYLPFSMGKLQSLEDLDLSSTKHLETIPEDISRLRKLHRLDLSYSNISSLPDSIGRLKQLECLNLHQCRNLKRLPESIRRLGSGLAYGGVATKNNNHPSSSSFSVDGVGIGDKGDGIPVPIRQRYLCACE